MKLTLEQAINRLYKAIISKNSLHIHGYLLISVYDCEPDYIERYITQLVLAD